MLLSRVLEFKGSLRGSESVLTDVVLVTFPLLPSNCTLFPHVSLVVQFAITCKYQQQSEVTAALFQVLGVAGPARVFCMSFLLNQGLLLSEEWAFRKAVIASVCYSGKDEQIWTTNWKIWMTNWKGK